MRLVSIVSFILVLAGSFYVMVTDIIAVNKFRKESREPGESAEKILAGCDYIKLRIARLTNSVYKTRVSLLTPPRLGTAPSHTKRDGSLGL